MHEATIAMAIIEQAVAAAQGHHVTRIAQIEVRVGALQPIVPEALDLAFEACAVGTIAEGAKLTLTRTPVVATCRPCGRPFEPDLERFNFACPYCHQADVRMTSGHEMILQSLVAEQDPGPYGER